MSRNGNHKADAIAELRRSVQALEADLASILKNLHTTAASAEALESEAMDAVHRGDDAAARSALVRREPLAARCEELEADAHVIRAMLAECAAVLDDSAT
jgi:phage shock protein A